MQENKEKENKKKNFHPKKISKDEMGKITSQIEERLHDFIKEGKYKEVLISMGNLGRYSLNNQIYILMQMPEATTVNGMKRWNTLGRHVKPGEKSIKIFAPITRFRDVEVRDEEGNTVLDYDGTPLKERKQRIVGYEQNYVFDISQTDGPEIDVFRFDKNKIVENKATILEGLRKVVERKGFTISYATQEELGSGTYGLCNHNTHEIKILENMSDLQEISTTVHECGHALAHSSYREDFEGLTQNEKREIKEVEAESIACVVCTYLGLDTENFNFSYITGWADGDISKFKKNLDVISSHARTLIKGIEKEVELEEKKEPIEDKTPIEVPTQLLDRNISQGMEMA
jgi:antirestriction protein ArdC